MIHTTLIGQVTDDELLAYYQQPHFEEISDTWREIVDGSQITEMAVTPEGQRQLAIIAAANPNKLRGGRVAMVALSDVTYGMFRMWEIQREELDYTVRVFRNFEEAQAWVSRS